MSTERLVLAIDGFADRTKDLFTLLDADQAARGAFMRDPTGMLESLLFRGDKHLPKAAVSRGNRLLYALLSNKQFLDWNAGFERQLKADLGLDDSNQNDPAQLKLALSRLDRTKLYTDVLKGIRTYADEDLAAVLLEKGEDLHREYRVSVPGEQLIDIYSEIETFVFALVAVVAFGIALAAILVPLPVSIDVLDRNDLARIGNLLVEQLAERAAVVRAEGTLKQKLIDGI